MEPRLSGTVSWPNELLHCHYSTERFLHCHRIWRVRIGKWATVSTQFYDAYQFQSDEPYCTDNFKLIHLSHGLFSPSDVLMILWKSLIHIQVNIAIISTIAIIRQMSATRVILQNICCTAQKIQNDIMKAMFSKMWIYSKIFSAFIEATTAT